MAPPLPALPPLPVRKRDNVLPKTFPLWVTRTVSVNLPLYEIGTTLWQILHCVWYEDVFGKGLLTVWNKRHRFGKYPLTVYGEKTTLLAKHSNRTE